MASLIPLLTMFWQPEADAKKAAAFRAGLEARGITEDHFAFYLVARPYTVEYFGKDVECPLILVPHKNVALLEETIAAVESLRVMGPRMNTPEHTYYEVRVRETGPGTSGAEIQIKARVVDAMVTSGDVERMAERLVAAKNVVDDKTRRIEQYVQNMYAHAKHTLLARMNYQPKK